MNVKSQHHYDNLVKRLETYSSGDKWVILFKGKIITGQKNTIFSQKSHARASVTQMVSGYARMMKIPARALREQLEAEQLITYKNYNDN